MVHCSAPATFHVSQNWLKTPLTSGGGGAGVAPIKFLPTSTFPASPGTTVSTGWGRTDRFSWLLCLGRSLSLHKPEALGGPGHLWMRFRG